jgi:hypothetical protein
MSQSDPAGLHSSVSSPPTTVGITTMDVDSDCVLVVVHGATQHNHEQLQQQLNDTRDVCVPFLFYSSPPLNLAQVDEYLSESAGKRKGSVHRACAQRNQPPSQCYRGLFHCSCVLDPILLTTPRNMAEVKKTTRCKTWCN